MEQAANRGLKTHFFFVCDFEAVPRFVNRDSEHDQNKVDEMLEYENSIAIKILKIQES